MHILNPLSNELSVLRKTLLYNGLETIQFNQNRKNSDLNLFEVGKTYLKQKDKFIETTYVGLFMTGNKEDENWNTVKEKVNFYHLKGVVNALFTRLGLFQNEIISEENNDKEFAYGLNYLIGSGKKNKNLVQFGEVNASLQKQFDLVNPVFYAQINLDVLLQCVENKTIYQQVAKFPAVRRDLSLLLDSKITYEALKKLAIQQENTLLQEVNLFDVYEGQNLEEGKKSYTMSFVFQDREKTLTDNQVDEIMQKLIFSLTNTFNVSIR